jgi:pancreatic lipase-related protein 2
LNGKYFHAPADPAYPAFQDTNNVQQNLDPTDAEFVDVIHTCAGMLGHKENLGHVDFWPNNGKARQPGCDIQSDFVGACSHGRSYRYYAESVFTKTGFLAFECESYDDFQAKKCDGDPIPMGDATPTFARGSYYLETSSGPERFARFARIN